ncbi:4Fe-4S binding protein [Caldicellulosiruptor naganoensis]
MLQPLQTLLQVCSITLFASSLLIIGTTFCEVLCPRFSSTEAMSKIFL